MHFWSFYQKSLTTRPWPNLQMVHLWLERIVKMVHLCFVVTAFLELSLLQLQMFQNTQTQFKSWSRDQNLSSKTLSREVHISYWKMLPQEMSGRENVSTNFQNSQFSANVSHVWQIGDTKENFLRDQCGILTMFWYQWDLGKGHWPERVAIINITIVIITITITIIIVIITIIIIIIIIITYAKTLAWFK